MDQSGRDTINEWGTVEDTLGPIPYRDPKGLARCFTSKDNPAGSSTSNMQFKCDLTTIIKADSEYYKNSTLEKLCALLAGLMLTWD
jgi:hypothetical protein